MRFIHMSDLHLNKKFTAFNGDSLDTNICFGNALKLIQQRHSDIDFVIVSGDLVDDGDKKGYQILKDYFARYSHIRFYCCLGNHDSRKHFNEIILGNPANSEYYYASMDPKSGIRIISLNCEPVTAWKGNINENQFDWLAALKNNEIPSIVIMHHPLFVGPDIDSLSFQLENSSALQHILKEFNILGVFSGHLHYSASYALGKTPCYIAPSIGFGLHYDADYTAHATNHRGYNYVEILDGNIYVKTCFL